MTIPDHSKSTSMLSVLGPWWPSCVNISWPRTREASLTSTGFIRESLLTKLKYRNGKRLGIIRSQSKMFHNQRTTVKSLKAFKLHNYWSYFRWIMCKCGIRPSEYRPGRSSSNQRWKIRRNIFESQRITSAEPDVQKHYVLAEFCKRKSYTFSTVDNYVALCLSVHNLTVWRVQVVKTRFQQFLYARVYPRVYWETFQPPSWS